MRKRIEELARGKFECAEPILQISTDRVEIEVLEGKNYTGEFIITSVNHVPMKGMVYSSNPRMDCLTLKFEGEEGRIRYEFHSEGLSEGDIQKGDFIIVCNQGEYNLSFVVSVLNLYANSVGGSIRSLSDFTKLARENWEEARRVFYSPCFKNIIKVREEKERLLYSGIAGGSPTNQSMEEFLVSSGKKQQVEITAAEKSFEFYDVDEMRQEILTLQKNQWGYVSLSVTSDARFLVPEKEFITAEDFVGSICEFPYYLNPNEMHGGKNYGCLVLENVYQQLVFKFCVSFEEEGIIKSQNLRETRKYQVEMLKLYQDYRMKKIVTGKWAVRSCHILDALIARNPENIWYRLLKAQAFLANEQRQEAEWILDPFKREWKDKMSPQWGYYLYLRTLMEREESYIIRMTEEIEQIYLKYSEDTILFWCLLFLREDYQNNKHRKLKALEHAIMEGNESPLLYIEVYSMMMQEPFLLRHLDGFELRILNWARKQKMLTADIAEQITSVLHEKQGYQRLILLLTEACYEIAPTEQLTSAACAYLIKNQKYGKRFLAWYEKGVELKLRITGLYEAYVMSMDSRSIVEVPKIILMYFKYNNHLGYRQKAMLYVNIIANKERQPEVYQQYRQPMEQFANEQMIKRHMDDNLAVIYEEVLRAGAADIRIWEALCDVVFVHKITCFEKKAAYVIVLQKQLKRPQIVPLTNGVAYIRISSNDYCIFLEDSMGNRYCGSIPYQLEKLMYPGKYLRSCLEYASDNLSYLIYYFDSRKEYGVLGENDLHYFAKLMESKEISPKYAAYLCPKILRLMKETEENLPVEKYLALLDVSLLLREDRTAVMELLAENRMYDKAYSLVEIYGILRLSPPNQVTVLNHQIDKNNMEEDDALLGFCTSVFVHGTNDRKLLEYLVRYYHGSTKFMASIWKCAHGFGVDTKELEERIIVQMLYTAEFVDNVADIFESFQPDGDRLVSEAYLVYFSYCYFVKDTVVPESLFTHLWQEMAKDETVLVIKLAMLKYLCGIDAITLGQEKLLEKLMGEMLYQGMYFSFFKKISGRLSSKYHLYDKLFLEYHGEPNSRVQIHYKTDMESTDFITEDMNDIYQGIFVKELISFFGESVQYYITEETEKGSEVTESNCITNNSMLSEIGQSRYDILNEMLLSRTLEDEQGLTGQMIKYQALDERTERLFTVL